jgi:serine/threonine protein kinase/tetratricopeptide (TPR) repeat protein
MNTEAGRRFGPYEIQSRLAGGGMGHVYRAWDARLRREVAIKLLNHEFAMPGMRERFLREARAASALNHPNICTIFDIGEQDGDPYLVMELLEGETLKDRILAGQLPLEEIVAIARDTAEALGAAHAKGIVHRDVKPANIFLVDKPNGGTQAKVLDFGLAKVEGVVVGRRGRSNDLTTEGATVGTLAYMSPEQARGEVLDLRSDLFSLGVVMYEMATRQIPFPGATSALVFVQLLNHAPEPVRDWNESIPRELEKIILKLLAKERTARFQTARELELALIASIERGNARGKERGRGGATGWLRRAAAAVPLGWTGDRTAGWESREKRSPSGSKPEPAKPATPAPTNAEPAPAPGSGDRILRPIPRIVRTDSDQNATRDTRPSGYRREADWSLMPAANLPPGYLPPSMRGLRTRGPVVPLVRDSEVTENRADAPDAAPLVPETKPPSGQTTRGKAQDAPASIASSAAQESVAGPARVIFPWDSYPEPNDAYDAKDRQPRPARAGTRSRKRSATTPIRRWAWAACALVVGTLGVAWYLSLPLSRFGTAALNKSDVVAMTEVRNRTADRSLDGAVSEALRIELAQSSYLTFRGGSSYRAARGLLANRSTDASQDAFVLARAAAQRLGARAYVTGALNSAGSVYFLHLDLRDVASDRILASVEEHAESSRQIPELIDQVATELRIKAGEPRASVDRANVGLAHEASTNLAAIDLFSQAETQLASREPIAALADLQQAVALDPRFMQAQTQLALLYDDLRAETSAAESARLALAATDAASERTRAMAQAVYALEATGDYPQATASLRQVVDLYPGDAEALALLARTLNLEGHLTEALQFAERAYAADALNARAYSEAEYALVGLDRFHEAFELDAQARQLGVARAADTLTAAYLDGHTEVVDSIVSSLPSGPMEYRPDWTYGLYLDNAGRLDAGTALWLTRADAASQNTSPNELLRSASAFLLSQGALDRALLNDCAGALAMIRQSEQLPQLPFGRQALFKSGMARALCGDTPRATQIVAELQQRYPNSVDVNGFFMADLQAAIALNQGTPAIALQVLKTAPAFDPAGLTSYLLGRANADLHQWSAATGDFQAELSHRGLAFLLGSDVYPAAEIGLARSLAEAGEPGGSADAYGRFLTLWSLADPDQPLMAEARVHAANH